MSGGKSIKPVDREAQQRWDQRYADSAHSVPDACYALTRYQHLLPLSTDSRPPPRALDFACGLGGNAIMLSQLGLVTEAWDISTVAIAQLREHAKLHHLTLSAQVRDVVHEPPSPQSFDVIVVSRFLDRAVSGALQHALKPGGLLYYQTFTRYASNGPKNPDFQLRENELLALFSSLRVRAFEDGADCGQVARGLRNESFIVAQKTMLEETLNGCD